MRYHALQALVCFIAFLALGASGRSATVAAQPSVQPRFVLVLTRHGVRSPTSPTELAPYTSQAWPKWEVAPGYLTPHGAALMRQFGAYYRSYYASLFPATGCPAQGTVFIWADVDERTIATGKALADGIAPGCDVNVGHGPKGKDDLLFDPLPTLGRADTALSKASTLGAIGADPNAVVDAYRGAYAALDRVLGCSTGCKKLSNVGTTIDADPDSGLTGVSGGLDAAGTAAENLLLEYTDGMPAVGWGRADESTILDIMQLHAVKSRVEHETYYNARAEGSNLLAHIAATLDQSVAGTSNGQTRVPASARFAVIVGHDTSLSKMAGMLHLSWLMKGYLFNDTPPGGALVFEVYTQGSMPAFIRLFFTAQSLAQMRAGDGAHPARVPVYVPGCPDLDCPVTTFDAIVQRSLDKRLVGAW
ncbi:MAG: histidine-type phosphatase [Candidatus Eremiobacteraeota bacterium]|nr:histidine-type phosphatase [Candidatus Eremiobacteraeota bacterium]